MVHRSVYAAGPISGLSYDEATDWRELARAELAKYGIKVLSPLRAEIGLKNADKVKDSYTKDELEKTFDIYREANQVMLHSRGVTTRDRFDCMNCSVVFVNLLNAKKISIGTVLEIAWADSARIPIVAVMEPGNLHEHAMINECIGFRVSSVLEGIEIIKAILSDY